MSIQNRYQKIQRLRELGAPKWIIKLEQLMIAIERYNITSGEERDRLFEKHVEKYQDGNGYITVPE